MNKENFLSTLMSLLSDLPSNVVLSYISYYNELIEDSMETGLSEQEAVLKLGDINDIAENILKDNKDKVKHKKKKTLYYLLGAVFFGLIYVLTVLFPSGVSVYPALMDLSLLGIIMCTALCVHSYFFDKYYSIPISVALLSIICNGFINNNHPLYYSWLIFNPYTIWTVIAVLVIWWSYFGIKKLRSHSAKKKSLKE